MRSLNSSKITILLLLLFSSGIVQAQFTPVPLTSSSFTHDVIAETGNNPVTVTTSGLDGIAGNVLFSASFLSANYAVLSNNSPVGLPDNGLISNGGDTWQLQPYNGKNVMLFQAQNSVSTKSMYLTTPAKFLKINLLAAAGYGAPGFGATSVMTVTLHYTDNSITSYGNYTVYDWFNNTPYVIGFLGRVARTTPMVTNNAPAGSPRLYQYVVTLNPADQAKYLDRIDILDNSTDSRATIGIFAVSGISSVLLPITVNSLTGVYLPASGGTQLSWNAENTSQTSVFTVERGTDGTVFNTVGEILPHTAQDNTQYTYTDRNVMTGQTYFYRIREGLFNGSQQYSNVCKVQTSGTISFDAVSHSGSIHISGNYSGQTTYLIFNMTGQLCGQGRNTGSAPFDINIQDQATGIYVLRLVNQQQTATFQFLR